jgi:hypothetical protein
MAIEIIGYYCGLGYFRCPDCADQAKRDRVRGTRDMTAVYSNSREDKCDSCSKPIPGRTS